MACRLSFSEKGVKLSGMMLSQGSACLGLIEVANLRRGDVERGRSKGEPRTRDSSEGESAEGRQYGSGDRTAWAAAVESPYRPDMKLRLVASNTCTRLETHG